MQLIERQVSIPASPGHRNMIAEIQKEIEFRLEDGVFPVRFAITHMDETDYQCEFGTLDGLNAAVAEELDSIFRFVRRKIERTETFNTVFLVPTGVGAESQSQRSSVARRPRDCTEVPCRSPVPGARCSGRR